MDSKLGRVLSMFGICFGCKEDAEKSEGMRDKRKSYEETN